MELTGRQRFIENDSRSSSSVVSPVTGTATVLTVSPGAKVSVPLTDW